MKKVFLVLVAAVLQVGCGRSAPAPVSIQEEREQGRRMPPYPTSLLRELEQVVQQGELQEEARVPPSEATGLVVQLQVEEGSHLAQCLRTRQPPCVPFLAAPLSSLQVSGVHYKFVEHQTQ